MKSIRLKNFDYSREKYYFVTVLPYNKNVRFGHIDDGVMYLNPIGNIIKEKWLWLFYRYDHIVKDEFVIMPDHFHAILKIDHACVEDGPYFAKATNGRARPFITLSKTETSTSNYWCI